MNLPILFLLTGLANVIDGDTVEIQGRYIRLHGIDAPEHDQSCTDAGGQHYNCGQVAIQALADKIGGHPVTCTVHETDSYGRPIATCLAHDMNLNAWMVRQGHALAYTYFSREYLPEQAEAQSSRRGLWAGSFTKPWNWRYQNRK
ncbi:MAG: thermonuclease family protein [Rhodobacteraceae bacterium]|nr:thermonuclease family protein [Paracoccaceae bacterium]